MTVPEHLKKKENLKKLSLLSTFKSFATLFPCFASRALTSLIMPLGITGKSGPEY